MNTSRSGSYSLEENTHLCYVYFDVSQNPIIGINQSQDQFDQEFKLNMKNLFTVNNDQNISTNNSCCNLQAEGMC